MLEIVSAKQMLDIKCFSATEDFRTIITFYVQILEFACRTLGIVPEAKMESINQLIQADLTKEFNTPLKRQNMLYCMNCYLKQKKNSEALDYLLKINSLADVGRFVNDTSAWIVTQQQAMKAIINSAPVNSSTLREAKDALITLVSELSNWTQSGITASFAKLHRQAIPTGTVILSGKVSYSETYFERLMHTIEAFTIELSIMDKIHASGIIKANSQMENDEKAQSKQLIDVETEFNLEMSNLMDSYQKWLLKKEAVQEKIDNFTRDMSDEELDMFFESDHPLLKEYMKYDEVAMEAKVQAKIHELESKYEHEISLLESNIPTMRLNIVSDIITLAPMVKEYALFVLASQGKVAYPDSLDEKEQLLQSIDLGAAISLLIEDRDKFQFSDAEISYLRTIN